MVARNIVISVLDRARLRDIVATAKQFGSPDSELVLKLDMELQRATVLPPDEMPRYVVTMNTCVCLIDIATKAETRYTLVYPGSADPEKGRISILSELGVAIIGFSVGDTIEWVFPDGKRCLRIGAIHFQPEAAKQYEM